jgi:hypothetical protein
MTSTAFAPEMTVPVDAEELARADMLRSRAEHLRHEAGDLHDVLARTYRRRASELDLAAWVHEVRSGLPSDRITPVAA